VAAASGVATLGMRCLRGWQWAWGARGYASGRLVEGWEVREGSALASTWGWGQLCLEWLWGCPWQILQWLQVWRWGCQWGPPPA